MERIIFCDYSDSFLEPFQDTFGPGTLGSWGATPGTVDIEVRQQDIRQVIGDNYCYVSPANSYLYFDGGVDYYYGQMFPKLQADAQEAVKKYRYQDQRDQYYLPLGSAMLVPVVHKKPQYQANFVVACPTMTLPQDIRGTRLPYWAFYAGLVTVQKYNTVVRRGRVHGLGPIKTLVCPAFGTGCGNIPYQESAQQMKQAYQDLQLQTGFQVPDSYPDDPMSFIRKYPLE